MTQQPKTAKEIEKAIIETIVRKQEAIRVVIRKEVEKARATR